MAYAHEYRVTAQGPRRREDVGGAGSPFRDDEPMWKNFHEGELYGVRGLCQALLEDAVADGKQELHIERRRVGSWERVA